MSKLCFLFAVILSITFCDIAIAQDSPTDSLSVKPLTGKLKVKKRRTICKRRASTSCGFTLPNPGGSEIFVFPAYFQGPFPPNTFERDGWKMVEGVRITTETIPSEDGQGTEEVYVIEF
ncbi:MAG: hypothetical protein JJT94_01680 [Bernardetiaceae bacterium]|nr:hypothetical protein [Bernardetiaceae bacterium]